jgi:von Willebrand factor type A domain
MQTSFQLVSSKKPTSIAGETNEYNRGIFKIDIPALSYEGGSVRQKMKFIMYVSVDASGSMEETATRRGQAVQSKMDFVHMTLTNMIDYIASQEEENPHAEFYIAIVSFDSSASCAILPCRVTRENKDQLIETVKNIRPHGGTNFQKCFQEIARLMSTESEYIKSDETISEEFIQRMHIFLTDGANNEGEKRVQQLATLLTPTITVPQKPATQIMIGYGPDHDSTMLQSLCSQFPKSKQWFIDDAEKTGCIFGEILWSAANTAYADVKLSSNVEFYDFTSMSWNNEIHIDDLIYDSSRTFYVRVPWSTESVICDMTYFSTECPSNTSRKTQALIAYSPEEEQEETQQVGIDHNVEQELWRLDTVRTVNEALKFLQNMRLMPYNVSVEEKDRLIGVVTAFQEKFLAYVSEKNLSEDPFMIQLADDLFVCISGLMAASIGERYIAARQASQIQQRSVTVNDITPLQTEILSSMPSASLAYGNQYDDERAYDYYPPAAPRRAQSGGGCVDDDTYPSPRTPTTQIVATPSDETKEEQEAQENKENDKLVSDFTPSSRGVGSRLRYLSRESILGMRGPSGIYHGGECASGNEGDYSCGGAGDDTFSSHASPGCARIGRMLSAATPCSLAPNRTSTMPY